MTSTTFVIARHQIGRLYTNDQNVLAVVPKIVPIAATAAVEPFDLADPQFMDGVQVNIGGLLRGAGKPHAGTVLNFFGFYVIGVTLYIG